MPGRDGDRETVLPELDLRKRAILRAIVRSYIADGEPIGSARVKVEAALDCSAATVRNDMAVLEELGLIDQPHTSAGRIPTDLGYRAYVEEVQGADGALIGDREREAVDQLLSPARDVDDLLTRTTTVLAQLTRLVSLVIAPTIDEARLKLIELVGMTPTTALLLLVADTGRVEKRMLDFSSAVSESDLDRVRVVLSEQIPGTRMAVAGEKIAALVPDAPPELREILSLTAEVTALAMTSDMIQRIYVSGSAALADAQSFEREQLAGVLDLLEEQATLARVLDSTTAQADDTMVLIGDENEHAGLKSTSLVAQRYQLVTSGSLGVLGPTRMDYPTVLSTVRAVAEQLETTLTDLAETGSPHGHG